MAQNAETAAKVKKPRKKLSVIFKQLISDLKKITWPSGKSVVKSSVTVLIVMVVGAGVIGLVDLGLQWLLKLIIGS